MASLTADLGAGGTAAAANLKDNLDDLADPVSGNNNQKADDSFGDDLLAPSDFFGVAAAGKESKAADEKVD
jgi:hypothetical protein